MTSDEPPQRPAPRFAMEISSGVEAGTYADFMVAWHTPDTFVLDFACLTKPPFLAEDGTSGTPIGVFPGRVVSRVRIPPGQIWEVMRALNTQLLAWEQETGKRMPPPEPNQDPDLPQPD